MNGKCVAALIMTAGAFGCGTETNAMLTTIDPASMWIFQPRSATIASNDDGGSWDIDGSAPDVIVRSECPSGTSAETIEVESYNPTWSAGGCTARADKLVVEGVDVEIFDNDDAIDSDDGVASTTVRLRESDLTAGMVTITSISDL